MEIIRMPFVPKGECKVGEGGFYERIKEEFGQRQIRHSCIADASTEEIFRSFLRNKNIELAIETGTFYGTATAILAQYAKNVITIDINIYNNEALVLWANQLVPANKITYCIIDKNKDREEKEQILKEINHNFDFAFIDGDHRDGVITDFELLKSCGRVLFHDYFRDIEGIPGMKEEYGSKPSPWILDLVDSLPKDEVTIREPFAYWESNKWR